MRVPVPINDGLWLPDIFSRVSDKIKEMEIRILPFRQTHYFSWNGKKLHRSWNLERMGFQIGEDTLVCHYHRMRLGS